MKVYANLPIGRSVFNVSYSYGCWSLQILLKPVLLSPLLTLSFPKYFSSERVVYGRPFSPNSLLLYRMVRSRRMSTFYNLPTETPSSSWFVPSAMVFESVFPVIWIFFSPTSSPSHTCHILNGCFVLFCFHFYLIN